MLFKHGWPRCQVIKRDGENHADSAAPSSRDDGGVNQMKMTISNLQEQLRMACLGCRMARLMKNAFLLDCHVWPLLLTSCAWPAEVVQRCLKVRRYEIADLQLAWQQRQMR